MAGRVLWGMRRSRKVPSHPVEEGDLVYDALIDRTRTNARHRFLVLTVSFLLGPAGASACSADGDGGSTRGDSTRSSDETRQGDAIEALLERPVELPVLDRDDPCPFSGAIHLRGIPSEAGLGPGTDPTELAEGPVYLAFPAIPRNLDLLPPTKDGQRRATILVVSNDRYGGPVLLRGSRLSGGAEIGLARGLQSGAALRLPAGSWDELKPSLRVWGSSVRPPRGWRVAIVELVIEAGGCYGVQVDGAGSVTRSYSR